MSAGVELGSDVSSRRLDPVSLACLFGILVLAVWLRCRTIAPEIQAMWGLRLWPDAGMRGEPLDCDESYYAYLGRRIAQGDVLYRDLTENKPPLGYWLYALPAVFGGASELSVRILPIPFALATIVLCWASARKVAGPLAGLAAALALATIGTDPFVFGNGANLEHFMNCFSTAALAILLHRPGRPAWLFGAGVLIAAASLVKPPAAVNLLPALAALAMAEDRLRATSRRRWALARLGRAGSLLVGFASLWGPALLILALQGALAAGLEDFGTYARGLALATPADPSQPSRWVRWLTGNASPEGRLPWPFGPSTYLAWWGAGLYPLWAVAAPITLALLFNRRGGRGLIALWTLCAWVQVVAPGLYWQHYYMLLLPPLAIGFGTALVDVKRAFWEAIRRKRTAAAVACFPGLVGLLLAASTTLVIQWQEYVRTTPELMVERDKGGKQWLALREFGERLRRASPEAFGTHRPKIVIWGIQSPLYIYAHCDSATRHGFTDDLLKNLARENGAAEKTSRALADLASRRLDEIARDVREKRPELVFAGYPPFPKLAAILKERYFPAQRFPNDMGLWVRSDLSDAFVKTMKKLANE